jgi:hypothetical protein
MGTIPVNNIVELLKKACDFKNEAWREMRRHPLWKAIEKEIEKAPRTSIVELPERTHHLIPDYNGNGGTCGSGVSLDEVSRAAGGAFIRFSAEFEDEDGERHEREYSLGVPDDLLLNFTPVKFRRFVAAHRAINKDRAIKRAARILADVGVNIKLPRVRGI